LPTANARAGENGYANDAKRHVQRGQEIVSEIQFVGQNETAPPRCPDLPLVAAQTPDPPEKEKSDAAAENDDGQGDHQGSEFTARPQDEWSHPKQHTNRQVG
jgi:hypothetical protein